MSMAPIATEGCTNAQSLDRHLRLRWCPRDLLMLEPCCHEWLVLPLGSCDVWAWTVYEGMVCVYGLAVAGVCDDVNGLCCHRRSQEPSMLKSEDYAEPALLLNVWHFPSLNTAEGELAPPSMGKLDPTIRRNGLTAHHGCGRAGPYDMYLGEVAPQFDRRSQSQWPGLINPAIIKTYTLGLWLAHSNNSHVSPSGVLEEIGLWKSGHRIAWLQEVVRSLGGVLAGIQWWWCVQGLVPDQWPIAVNILWWSSNWMEGYIQWHTAASRATAMNKEVLERWKREVVFCVYFVLNWFWGGLYKGVCCRHQVRIWGTRKWAGLGCMAWSSQRINRELCFK